MRFGLDVTQHQLEWDEIVSRAKLAEDAGFDGVWVFDHFKALYADPKGPCLEGWTLLAGLARETSRVRLGTLVTGMTHRIPSVLAAEVVTVDHLSGGRVECAVGAAWNEPEHRELGIPFPSLRDRMDRLEEGVQVLKLLFTQDDVSFEGRQVRLDHATYRPRPGAATASADLDRGLRTHADAADDRPLRGRVARGCDRRGRPSIEDGDHRPSRGGSGPRPGVDPAGLQPVDQRAVGRGEAFTTTWMAAGGIGYLVVSWPGEGRGRVEEFIEQVMPTLD